MLIRYLLAAVVMFGLLAAAGKDSGAVIYKYVDEKGDIIFADDLQKVPEQRRSSAVMVSGGGEQEAAVRSPEEQEAERVRIAAVVEAVRQEQARAEAHARAAFRSRLIRSAGAAAAVLALVFALTHVDALKERRSVLNGIRAALLVGLTVLLAVMHFQDVARAFRHAGSPAGSPFADIQDRQAARGRKAAESMKVFHTMIDQVEQRAERDARQIEKKFEDAEQGK